MKTLQIVFVVLICVVITAVIILLSIWSALKSRNGRAGRHCQLTSDCSVGQICNNFVCTAPNTGFCVYDDQCVRGSRCIAGFCVGNDAKPIRTRVNEITVPEPETGPTPWPLEDQWQDDITTRGPLFIRRRNRRSAVVNTNRSVDTACKRRKVHFNEPVSEVFEVLEGDIRSEFARKIQLTEPICLDDIAQTLVKPVHFGVPVDLLAQITVDSSDGPGKGVAVPRAVSGDNTLVALLPAHLNKDVTSMAVLRRGMVFLLEDTGDLVLSENAKFEEMKYLPSDRHMRDIVAFGRGLLGVSEGVLYALPDLNDYLPNVANWIEVEGIPTRQIVHISASEDLSTLVVNDNSHMYTFDSNFKVVKDSDSTDSRFLGPTADVFADVGIDGMMTTSSGRKQAGVARVAFVDANTPVALSITETRAGVRSISAANGKLFYISRQA
jgi:hypothetical protein